MGEYRNYKLPCRSGGGLCDAMLSRMIRPTAFNDDTIYLATIKSPDFPASMKNDLLKKRANSVGAKN